MKGGKSEGETNHERLWTLKNKLRVLERRRVGGWVNPIKFSKSLPSPRIS